MRGKAKVLSDKYSMWVEGEYIETPPVRPRDNMKRPKGHYIDKGGYPGANVYEIYMDTFCHDTGRKDKMKNAVYEKDYLLYETEGEFSYLMAESADEAVDLITGEILSINEIGSETIKVIGNMIDYPDFMEYMELIVQEGGEIPYISMLSTVKNGLPFMRLECSKCSRITLSCRYIPRCACGGTYKMDFATKMNGKSDKEKILA